MSGQQETNIDGAAVGANVADVPPPTLPQQAAPQGKPADMQKAFFEQLVASKLPQELVAYMSSENINALADLPQYCTTKEQVWDLLVQKCDTSRDQFKFRVPLGHLWDIAKNPKRAN